MKDVMEYKVSFGFRVETNRVKANPHTRMPTQRITIPLMTAIGMILQPIIKAVLQYTFPK